MDAIYINTSVEMAVAQFQSCIRVQHYVRIQRDWVSIFHGIDTRSLPTAEFVRLVQRNIFPCDALPRELYGMRAYRGHEQFGSDLREFLEIRTARSPMHDICLQTSVMLAEYDRRRDVQTYFRPRSDDDTLFGNVFYIWYFIELYGLLLRHHSGEWPAGDPRIRVAHDKAMGIATGLADRLVRDETKLAYLKNYTPKFMVRMADTIRTIWAERV